MAWRSAVIASACEPKCAGDGPIPTTVSVVAPGDVDLTGLLRRLGALLDLQVSWYQPPRPSAPAPEPMEEYA